MFLRFFQIFFVVLIVQYSFAVEQFQDYLGENYSSINKIYQKQKNALLKKLIVKILQEGKIKNIPAPMVEEFLKYEKNNFSILDKWIVKYKIKEFEFLDNVFELLRNDFSRKILIFMLEKKEHKNFREKFAKALYFYIYYISHDLLDDALEGEDEYDFKNQDISLIAYSVFQINPTIQYLNELIDIIQSLKNKKIDINQSTRMIYKMVLKKISPQVIFESIKEIPGSEE